MKTILWIALAALIGSYICLRVADPDLWWHITVGKWILANHTIPNIDHWNMFGVGRPWRAYSWSNEILLALADRWWGPAGLLTLQLLLAVLLAATLQWVCFKISGDGVVGTLIGVYATVACYNNYTLRPQAFVWILYALVLLVSNSISREGITKKALFKLALIGCVWANSHLTAILGLAGVFLWCVQGGAGAQKIKHACTGSIVFFVGTLFTPYMGGEWLTFISKGGHPLKYSVIAEFQPATILQYSTVFMVLLIVLQVVGSYTSRRVPPPSRCLLAGGMILAGLTAVKFLPFASITLCAVFASWWAESRERFTGGNRDGLTEGLMLGRERFLSLSPATHGALAFFFSCLAAANISPLFHDPLDTRIVPKGAVDFIQEHKLPGPLLHEFGAGGYVMYRFSNPDGTPGMLVPIDGRTNVNPPEIWEMYQISAQGGIGWRRYINAVKPETVLWRQGSPFVSLLFASREWCRVYTAGNGDNDFSVFIKKAEFHNRPGEFTSTNCPPYP